MTDAPKHAGIICFNSFLTPLCLKLILGLTKHFILYNAGNKNKNCIIPATKTPQATAIIGILKKYFPIKLALIKDMFNKIGIDAGNANLLCRFNTLLDNAAKQINPKYGNVIINKLALKCNLVGSPIKPGANK